MRNPREQVADRKLAISEIIRIGHIVLLELCILVITLFSAQKCVDINILSDSGMETIRPFNTMEILVRK